ncbi:unnamed protein product [Calypogeia fissa]
MTSFASLVLVYPSTTAAEQSRRNRGRISNPPAFSVPSPARAFVFGSSRARNLQQHFGVQSSKIISSSPPPPFSSETSITVHWNSSRPSSKDPSSPTNATREDDPLSSGRSLAGLDPLSSSKEQSIVKATTTPDSFSSRLEVEHSTPEQSVWKALQHLQRGATLVLASVILACTFLPNAAHCLAENSIGASKLGIEVAEYLRRSGLSDELVVLIVGMLPVLELRAAIPISYWLKMEPVKGYFLSVLGNMIPVPFILLFLDKVLKTVGEKGETGQTLVGWIVNRTRKQAGPIEEFEWLGLMLFVAVPLPGTGAWSGAIAASILGMPFWDAVTANLGGVILAGLLVTLLVTVGTKEAVIVGIILFVTSCCVWSVLRFFHKTTKRTSSL